MENTENIENDAEGAAVANGGAARPSVGGSDDLVTPWEVTSSSQAGVDYDKLLGKTITQYSESFDFCEF